MQKDSGNILIYNQYQTNGTQAFDFEGANQNSISGLMKATADLSQFPSRKRHNTLSYTKNTGMQGNYLEDSPVI